MMFTKNNYKRHTCSICKCKRFELYMQAVKPPNHEGGKIRYACADRKCIELLINLIALKNELHEKQKAA